jgi:hypothetical protein
MDELGLRGEDRGIDERQRQRRLLGFVLIEHRGVARRDWQEAVARSVRRDLHRGRDRAVRETGDVDGGGAVGAHGRGGLAALGVSEGHDGAVFGLQTADAEMHQLRLRGQDCGVDERKRQRRLLAFILIEADNIPCRCDKAVAGGVGVYREVGCD